VAISVFRLTGSATRSAGGKGVLRKHVATVYRKVRRSHKAKRYVYRLTEKALRNLAPGRYLIRIRVGRNRAKLGPAAVHTVAIKRARPSSAR